VDGPRFDALTQRFASVRLTRARALRGMAVSALTLTGVVKVADEASAAKKPYCACQDASATCTDETAGRKARKKYIKQHPCSYKGACRGETGTHNPCDGAGAAITVNINLLGNSCTVGGGECGEPGVTGLECVGLICVPVDLGDVCAADADCSTGRCAGLVCVDCPVVRVCGDGADAQCCVAEAECVDGLCLLPLDSL
jgi:hypothetical protein